MNLLMEIIRMKKQLLRISQKYEYNLIHPAVIKMSQCLDQKIIEYYNQNRNSTKQ